MYTIRPLTTSLTSHPCMLPFVQSTPASLTSPVVPQIYGHSPITGPLHSLFPMPRQHSPRCLQSSLPYLLQVCSMSPSVTLFKIVTPPPFRVVGYSSCGSVTTPCNCSTPSFPVLHHPLKFAQTPLSQWCHPSISSSVIPFSCSQSFPASGSFPTSRLFASGGQSIGVSALAKILPVNIQGWFPSGLTSLISLQSKGLSRVFSSTTIWKHQFFSAQTSLWSSSHIAIWPLEKHSFVYIDICQQSYVSAF